jgi:hypothetical protein
MAGLPCRWSWDAGGFPKRLAASPICCSADHKQRDRCGSPNRCDAPDQSVEPPIDARTKPGHRACDWRGDSRDALHRLDPPFLRRAARLAPAADAPATAPPAGPTTPASAAAWADNDDLGPFHQIVSGAGARRGWRQRCGLSVFRPQSRTDCCRPGACQRDSQEPAAIDGFHDLLRVKR